MPTKRTAPKAAKKPSSPKKTVKKVAKKAPTAAFGDHIHPYGTPRHADLAWQRMRLRKRLSELPDNERDLIERALSFSEERHSGQKRKGGSTFVIHPIRIANILMDEWNILDKPDVIAAALLHDVVEDTQTTIKEIKDLFGNDVGKLVDGMTMWKGSETFEIYCKRVKRGPQMLRVIKCADAMDNLRSWYEFDDEAKCAVWWRQTHEHVIPIANSVSEDIAVLFTELLDDEWYLKKAGLL